MSLVPVQSEQGTATCASCGAPLVADQRYCLSCGEPASPVRLAFLDVLHGQSGPAGAAHPLEMSVAGYVPAADARGANGWLRRNSGLLGLLAVLLLCLIAGLLVGHWVGQGGSKVPAKQVVEVKGLSGLAAAPAASSAAAPASSAASAASAKAKAAEKKEEEEEKAEAAKETKAEKAPPAAPVKVTPQKIKKLTQSTGKKHQEEINSLGTAPIETG